LFEVLKCNNSFLIFALHESMPKSSFCQRSQIKASLSNEWIPTIIKKSNDKGLFRIIITKSFLIDSDVIKRIYFTLSDLTFI